MCEPKKSMKRSRLMAKLFAAQRNALPKNDFALPGKRAFPIPDKTHAVLALRMKSFAPPAEQSEITSKVKSAFPGIGKKAAPAQGPSLMKRLTGK